MPRYVVELTYRGTRYAGWQIQRNTPDTVQRIVHEKLSVLLRCEITGIASGRTDAGVHARQNFMHFDYQAKIPKGFLRRINFMLPEDIAVRNIFRVKDDFNARFDALSRSYEYLIAYDKNPLLSATTCYYPYEELPLKKLNEAAAVFKSHDDFAAFSKKRTQVKTTFCKILAAQWNWDKEARLLRFNITADRFLRGMVRGIVATSIRHVRGKLSLAQLQIILASKQPHHTDFSAPASGLTLVAVKYRKGVMKELKE